MTAAEDVGVDSACIGYVRTGEYFFTKSKEQHALLLTCLTFMVC